jgi:hypothetical protein
LRDSAGRSARIFPTDWVCIGVPITIVLLAFCAQHHASRSLADLLGGTR